MSTWRRHLWAVPLELVMAGGVVVTLAQGNVKHFAASLFSLIVSFLPLLIERRYRIILPGFVHSLYVMFVFASMFAGEVLHLYAAVPLWDDLMHVTSGFLMGLAVIFWLVILTKRRTVQIPPWFQTLMIFCLTATIAVLWEGAEFTSDQLFGTFSQGDDLGDTMMDEIYNLLGGLIMAVLWTRQLKTARTPILGRIVAYFERLQTTEKDVINSLSLKFTPKKERP